MDSCDITPGTARRRRAHSQPLANTDSESDASSELRNFVTESQEAALPGTVTARNVNPMVGTPKVIHPTLFKDTSKAPILPTTWNCEPQLMTCPKCGKTDLSETETRISETNWFYSGVGFMAAGLCFLSVCCPCCMDTAHVCRHCETEVGYRSAV